jgi:hypothetical protein
MLSGLIAIAGQVPNLVEDLVTFWQHRSFRLISELWVSCLGWLLMFLCLFAVAAFHRAVFGLPLEGPADEVRDG